MSTTQIPTGPPLPEPAPTPGHDGGDLYDSQHWEAAYREMHDVPALLIQLQDDLSRSRRREAFWISVVVHLLVVILFINADRFTNLFPRQAVLLVNPNLQKDPTYLELPPDEEKVSKRPDTNNISDKNRTAQSKSPRLDREELKKILDSARAGRPGQNAPPGQQPQPPAQAMAQAPPQPQEQASGPPPPPAQNTTPKLSLPQRTGPTPNFNANNLSPGSAIEQAARAALANRGASTSGGDGGDFGMGQSNHAKALGQLEVLNDTQGVDFGPYLQRVLHDVRENWYNLIPEVARAPLMKKGKVSIEFAIMKDARIAGMSIAGSSGDSSLDRAAWGGITASNPFPPLPGEFKGEYLALRFHFYYNPDRSDLQ